MYYHGKRCEENSTDSCFYSTCQVKKYINLILRLDELVDVTIDGQIMIPRYYLADFCAPRVNGGRETRKHVYLRVQLILKILPRETNK